MKIHANAALTIRQRQEIRRLFLRGASIRDLAAQFHVNPTTVSRWAHRDDPHDRSCAPRQPRTTMTEAYRQAVLDYRAQHPEQGPIRIAWALEARFPQANRGTVQRILQDAQATQHAERKPQERRPLPVGRHRIQVDIQQLPAIQGGRGFEYKITAIHRRTRLKYSEIHPDPQSATVAGFIRRALDRLPPFTWPGRTTPSSSR
jgi:hypothetical protein